MKAQFSLSGALMSSLLVISPLLTVQARAQDPGTLLAQTSVCENYSAEAAAQEAFLIQMIEQAAQEEGGQGIGLGNLQEFLRLAEDFLPDEFGDRVNLNQVTGLLNQLMSWLGKDNVQSAGRLDPEMVEIMETVRDRLTPLLRGSRGDLDPTEVVGILMDTASEIREVKARQPQSTGATDYLMRQLETLRRQCRSGRVTTATPSAPNPRSEPSLPRASSERASLPNNPYTRACEQQGGAISTYYEGENTGNRQLEYRQMIECIPGTTPVNLGTLQEECAASGGRWLENRSTPVCRL